MALKSLVSALPRDREVRERERRGLGVCVCVRGGGGGGEVERGAVSIDISPKLSPSVPLVLATSKTLSSRTKKQFKRRDTVVELSVNILPKQPISKRQNVILYLNN